MPDEISKPPEQKPDDSQQQNQTAQPSQETKESTPQVPSSNGSTQEKQEPVQPKRVLNEEQWDYVDRALRTGTMSKGEISIVLALAETKGIPAMEMQKRWMDLKIGIMQVGNQQLRDKGIITLGGI